MPVINTFRTCDHTQPGTAPVDWRQCYQCIDVVAMQLAIARAYLKEIAAADFNDDGICRTPLAEPIRGRGFQQIAATGLSACSDA